jgi:hypothetical protein
MNTKLVPVQYNDVVVKDFTITIQYVNGLWTVNSTSLINLYKELAKVIPNYDGIKHVSVHEDNVSLYSTQ